MNQEDVAEREVRREIAGEPREILGVGRIVAFVLAMRHRDTHARTEKRAKVKFLTLK